VVRIGVTFTAIITLSSGIAVAVFGSIPVALRYLRGERLVVEPTTISVGDGFAGVEEEAAFLIRNLSDKPVCILGATQSCTCLSIEQLPISILAHTSRVMRLGIRREGKSTERFEQGITYYTDSLQHPSFLLRIRGRIR
jgi:hypothetical protein